MSEMMQIIAETEGLRTPVKKRTRKDLQDAYDNHVAKKAMKKKTASVSSPHVSKGKSATPKPTAAKSADGSKKPAATFAAPIAMNFISPTGFVREAGYDPKTKMFYIAFAKSTWAMPSNPTEWETFEKAVADPLTDIDAHYRKSFRGRTADMIPVRSEVSK